MLSYLNNNPILVAIFMIIMNLSSKYIVKDIPKTWDFLFENIYFRRLVVFAIAFVSTHDIISSLMITLGFIIVFSYLLNEKSSFYILDREQLPPDEQEENIAKQKIQQQQNFKSEFQNQFLLRPELQKKE
jgi:hypothetical protein